jgi:hypothetical protein
VQLPTITTLGLTTLVLACGARSPIEGDRGPFEASPSRSDAGAPRDAAAAADSAPACAPGQGPTPLGPRSRFASDLRIDERYVYAAFDSNGPNTTAGVYRVPKRGGDAVVLESTEGSIRAIALSGDEVYWTGWGADQGGIGHVRARRVDGSAPARTLADGIEHPGGVAVSGDDVYVGGATTLLRVPRAGGAATAVTPSRYATRIVAEASTVFFLEARGLSSVAPDGSRLAMISGNVPSFAVDATTLFFPSWINNAYTIARRERAGGPILEIAQAKGGLVAVDETDVYWFGAEGIMATPKTGGSPRLAVARVVDGGSAMAVDASCVYWAAADGVMKAAKSR